MLLPNSPAKVARALNLQGDIRLRSALVGGFKPTAHTLPVGVRKGSNRAASNQGFLLIVGRWNTHLDLKNFTRVSGVDS